MAVLRTQPGVGRVVRHVAAEAADDLDVVETEVDDDTVDDVLDAVGKVSGSDDIQLSLTIAASSGRFVFEDSRPQPVKQVFVEELGASAGAAALSRLTRTDAQYTLLMVSAAVIATAGLIVDLPVAIMGAMAISPDLGRLNVMAFAVMARQRTLFLRGGGALAAGLLVAITTSSLVTLALLVSGEEDPLARIDERLTEFVSEVDGITVTVALAAGVASMVVFLTERGRAAVGVGVSITTIPAAALTGALLRSHLHRRSRAARLRGISHP